jgi:hypothetical protein
MALDPEEFVTLTNHGSMKLRAAVSRAMTLLPKERKRTTIVREGEPAILNFEQIKHLAAQWDERLVPIDQFRHARFNRAAPQPRRSLIRKVPYRRNFSLPRWGVGNVLTAFEPFTGSCCAKASASWTSAARLDREVFLPSRDLGR